MVALLAAFGCGGEAQRTGAKDPPRAEAHRAKMNALWSSARQARLRKAVRGASTAFDEQDVERLSGRLLTWTDAWVLSSAEVDSAAARGSMSPAEVAASRACLEVERVEYTAILDALNTLCRAPGCQAQRIADLDWQLVEAEQTTRACTQPAFYRGYRETNLAEPEAIVQQAHFLALEALGDDQRLGRYLTATLARHHSASAFRTRALLLEARRQLRSEATPASALRLPEEGIAEASSRGDALEVAALRSVRSDAHQQLSQFAEALSDARSALELTRRALGEEHVATALARASYASVALCDCDYPTPPDADDAERELDLARRTLTRVLGPTHPLTARIELAQGQVAASLGDAGAAQRWLTRGTSSTAVSFGAEHLAMSDAVRCNAKAEGALGNVNASMGLFGRALQLDRQFLGEVHPRVAAGWDALGVRQRGAKHLMSALASFTQSARVYQELGDQRALVGALLRISETYRALGQRADALRQAEQAEGLLQGLPEAQSDPLRHQVCTWLGTLHSELQRPPPRLRSCE
ncbi:MAG: tetratricopeptide repeat protein [Polyangiaceae bacterium]